MLELRAGRLRCELMPELGGCIAGLWLADVPVLRSTPAAQLASARLAGCYPLVPFSNRIGHASLVWQGTQHPLVRNNGDEPHAIHGVGWQRPWSVLDSDAASAMLSYEHRPDAAWPFAFDCSHTLRLRPGALEMTLALTNQSDQPAPAGLGWHRTSSSGRQAASPSRRPAAGRAGPTGCPPCASPRPGWPPTAPRWSRPLLRRLERHGATARRAPAHRGAIRAHAPRGLHQPARDCIRDRTGEPRQQRGAPVRAGRAGRGPGAAHPAAGETMVAQMAIEAETAP
jgi:hypothetical protein